MNETYRSASGAVVYWSIGDTDRQALFAELDRLGLSSFQPPARTDDSALFQALKTHCDVSNGATKRNGRVKIVQRRKKRKNGFEVVDVERGEDRNAYTTDFGALVNDSGQIQVDWGYADAAALQGQFEHFKNVLTGAAVGQALVKIVEHYRGVALRPTGGIYWIPEEAVAGWAQVGQAIERAGVGGERNKVYLLRTLMDDQAVRAVRDAITREVSEAAKEIAEDVAGGGLGEEALQTRKKKGAELHSRIKEYEGILDDTLSQLHETVSAVEQAVALAALQTMGV